MAKRVADWARSMLNPGPMILGYHRVGDVDWDPQRLCVSPRNFAEQLEVMSQVAIPITQQKLSNALREGSNLQRSFLVTLDDGYADSFEVAAPILERFGIPATVFIATGMIGGSFWWCEIEHLVQHSARLPAKLDVKCDHHSFHWKRGSNSLRSRAGLVQLLGNFFRSLPFDRQDEALQKVRAAFDNRAVGNSGVNAMTAEQTAALAKSELVEIGSHMVTHTSLHTLSPAEQRREMLQSKLELEEICGHPIESCAYPNGKYSKDTPGIAREAGYTSGYTTRQRLARSGCDSLLLPRLWPGDWDGERFSRWLKWWFR
jgi:peptidoglycan/xylan/chitin deacetylase (PgdA/CDA1 family)